MSNEELNQNQQQNSEINQIDAQNENLAPTSEDIQFTENQGDELIQVDSPEEPIIETTSEPSDEPAKEAVASEQDETFISQEDKKEEPVEKLERIDLEKFNEQEDKEFEAQKIEATFKKLLEVHANGHSIDVKVKNRIRGGLRVVYENMQLFLPSSHFSIKRNPSEDELQKVVGKTLKVKIHELQVDDNGRKTVIVSRKKILEDDFWENIREGDIVEGKISSVASFGVFVDLGLVEGLIHVSRLSQFPVRDPRKVHEKGQTIRCVVIEADKQKNRIALSSKELEESPWKNVETEFIVGNQYSGIVRRLTDFGAYIELKPGIDGLLRNSELSWTKRIKSPSEVLTPGEKIDVYVMSVSEEKQIIALSLKRTQPSPWQSLVQHYPLGSEYLGTISQIMPQGVIVSLDNEVDGFMPRSKIKPLMKGNKIPFKVGDQLNVTIADLIPEDESLIISPKLEEEALESEYQRKQPQKKASTDANPSSSGSFTIMDIISDKDKDSLIDTVS